jgi:hypothetical protein
MEGTMMSIDRAYMAIALMLLIVGEALGLYMGIGNDMRLRPVHITMVLPGFVTLALFGAMFRLWPAMKAGPLAAVQFWLGVLSTVGAVIGSYLQVTSGSIALLAVSSIVALASAVVLMWLFWTRSAEA